MKDYSFAHETKENPFKDRTVSRRPLILGIISLVITLVVLGLLVIHPTFALRSVAVYGANRVSTTEVADVARGTLNHKRFFVLPGDNFFVANLSEVEQVLLSRFPIAHLEMVKKFPGSLTITVTEKQAAIIFNDGQSYSALDSEGATVALIRRTDQNEWHAEIPRVAASNTSTLSISSTSTPDAHQTLPVQQFAPNLSSLAKEWQVLPILVKASTEEDIKVPTNVIEGVNSWNNFFQKTLSIPVSYYQIIDDNWHQAWVKTKEGWGVYIIVDGDRETQYEALATLLKQHAADRKTWQYVDVRYPGKIYWR